MPMMTGIEFLRHLRLEPGGDKPTVVFCTVENDIERMPPRDARPLSAIALSLEQRGLGGITDVEFDNRQWDVDVRNAQGQRAELKVDPMTAEITRCRGRACP